MRLLISNDDGIYSPGIAALADVARSFGEVVVVAPDVERSSAGQSISATRPLSYRRTRMRGGVEAYRVNGTPADCVALGLFHVRNVDVVLSGVNLGTNLGNGMWHSGTLAAAEQAALLGARGIALSTPVTADEVDFQSVRRHLAHVLSLLLPRDDLQLVNVNIPAHPRGIHWARQATEKYDGDVVPAKDPYGRPVFWLAVTQLEHPQPGTDLWAFQEGYISITPLKLDLTNHAALERLADHERMLEFEDSEGPDDYREQLETDEALKIALVVRDELDGEADFDRLIAQAIGRLPAEFRASLDSVAIVVDDQPTAWQLAATHAHGLYGIYEGVPRTAYGAGGAPVASKITLFRQPLEAHNRDAAALATSVEETLFHEIGHHLGISDARLRELEAERRARR